MQHSLPSLSGIPRLAVVIVNYKTCALLRGCLRSVVISAEASRDRLHVHIIVVDNASADGSAAMVEAEFPQALLLALEENVGFTGGNNLALQVLGLLSGAAAQRDETPDYVLLLNADAQVVDDALFEMVACLETNRKLAVCGAHLHYGDGRFQHGAFRFPTLAQIVLDLYPIYRLPGAHRLYNSPVNGRYPARLWHGSEPFPVDFVLGAALMIRGDAVREVGGLDDGFFMYCEEMDWCLRMRQAGWGVAAQPTAHVIHYEGQSSKQARWTSFVRLWRSRYRFFQKHDAHYSASYLFLARLIIRIAMCWRRRQVQRDFAAGVVNGYEAAEALHAYSAVSML